MGEFSQLYLNLKVVRVESEIISFTTSERLPCWSRTCWLGVEIIADNIELTSSGLNQIIVPASSFNPHMTNLKFPLTVVSVWVVLGVLGWCQVQTVALFKIVLRQETSQYNKYGGKSSFPSLDIVFCGPFSSCRRWTISPHSFFSSSLYISSWERHLFVRLWGS